jgi:hypothetical protein
MEKDEGKRKKDGGVGWSATPTVNSPTMGALRIVAARIVSEKRGGRKSKMRLGFEGQRAVEGFFCPSENDAPPYIKMYGKQQLAAHRLD